MTADRTPIGPVVFSKDVRTPANIIDVRELIELDRQIAPWLDPALSKPYTFALLAALEGYDAIDLGPLHAIITNEAVPLESSAIITGDRKALEIVRTGCAADLDYEYLIYRKTEDE